MKCKKKDTAISMPYTYLLSLFNQQIKYPQKDLIKYIDLIPYTLQSLVKLSFLVKEKEISFANIKFDGFGRFCLIKDMKMKKFELKELEINENVIKGEKFKLFKKRKIKKIIKRKSNKKGMIFSKQNIYKLPEFIFKTEIPLNRNISEDIKNYEENYLFFSIIFSQIHKICSQYLFEKKLSFLSINENFELLETRPLKTKEKKKSRFKIFNVLLETIRLTLKIVMNSFEIESLFDETNFFVIKFIHKKNNLLDFCDNFSLNTKIYRHKYKIMSFIKKLKFIKKSKIENKILVYRNVFLSLFRGLVPYLVVRVNSLVYRLIYGRKNRKKKKKETKQRVLSNLDIKIKKELFEEIKTNFKIEKNKKIFRKNLFKVFNEMWKSKKRHLKILNFDNFEFLINGKYNEKEQKFIINILEKYINKKYEEMYYETEKHLKKLKKVYENNKKIVFYQNLYKNRIKKDIKEYVKIPIYYSHNFNKKIDKKRLKLKFYDLSKNTKIHRTRLTRFLISEKIKKIENLEYEKIENLIKILNLLPNKMFSYFQSNRKETNLNFTGFLLYEKEFVKAKTKFLRKYQISEIDYENFISKDKENQINEFEFILKEFFEDQNYNLSTEIILSKKLLEKKFLIKKPNFVIPNFKKRRNSQTEMFLKDFCVNFMIDGFFNEILKANICKFKYFNKKISESEFDRFVENNECHVFEFKIEMPIFLLKRLLESENLSNSDNLSNLTFGDILLSHFIKRLDTKLIFKDMSAIPFFYENIYSFDESFQILFCILIDEIFQLKDVKIDFIKKNKFTFLCKKNNQKCTNFCNENIKKIEILNEELFIDEIIFFREIKRKDFLFEKIDKLVFNFSKILSATLNFSDLVKRYNNLMSNFLLQNNNNILENINNDFEYPLLRKVMETINSKMFSRYPLSLIYSLEGLCLLNVQFNTENKNIFYKQTDIKLFIEKNEKGKKFINYDKYFINLYKFLGNENQTFNIQRDVKIKEIKEIDFKKLKKQRKEYFYIKNIINNTKDLNSENTNILNTNILNRNITNTNILNTNIFEGKKILSKSQITALNLLPNKYFMLNWLPSLNTSSVFIGEKEFILKYIWMIGKLKGMRGVIKSIFEPFNIKNSNYSKNVKNKTNLYDQLKNLIIEIFKEYFNSQKIDFENYQIEMFRPDFYLKEIQKYLLIVISLSSDCQSIYEEFKNQNMKNIQNFSLFHLNISQKEVTVVNFEGIISLKIFKEILIPKIFNSYIFSQIELRIKNLLNLKIEDTKSVKSYFENILKEKNSDFIFLPKEGIFCNLNILQKIDNFEKIEKIEFCKENKSKTRNFHILDVKEILKNYNSKEIIETNLNFKYLEKFVGDTGFFNFYEILNFYNSKSKENKENKEEYLLSKELKFENFCILILLIQSVNLKIKIDFSFVGKITEKLADFCNLKIENDDFSDFRNILNFYQNFNLKNYEIRNVEKIKAEFRSNLNHLLSFLSLRVVQILKEKKKIKRNLKNIEIRNLIFNLPVLSDFPGINFYQNEIQIVFERGTNREFFEKYFQIQINEKEDYFLKDFKKDLNYVRDLNILKSDDFIFFDNSRNKENEHLCENLLEILEIIKQKNKKGEIYFLNKKGIQKKGEIEKDFYGIFQNLENFDKKSLREKYGKDFNILITFSDNILFVS